MTVSHLTLCGLDDTGTPRVESYSPDCVKVHRALSLAGFPFGRRETNRSDVSRHDPATRTPLLLIDGRPVSDAAELVSLVDVLSGGALSSGLDRRARAEAFLCEEMASTVLNGYLVAARWLDDENWPRTRTAYFGAAPPPVRAVVPGRFRTRVRERMEARDVLRSGLDGCWSRFVVTLDELEARAPQRGFWLGEAPSRADIAIFAQLWSFRTALTPRQASLVEARRRLSSWLERVDAACTARPARASALALPTRARPSVSAFA